MILDFGRLFVTDSMRQDIDLTFDFSNEQYRGIYPFTAPVRFTGYAENRAGAVTLCGQVCGDYTALCDRCGEMCTAHVTAELRFTLVTTMANDDERVDFLVIPDKKLDIAQVALEELILALPSKHLCRDDCRGFCSGCGANLNRQACTCDKDDGDPRLAVLKTLLK